MYIYIKLYDRSFSLHVGNVSLGRCMLLVYCMVLFDSLEASLIWKVRALELNSMMKQVYMMERSVAHATLNAVDFMELLHDLIILS